MILRVLGLVALAFAGEPDKFILVSSPADSKVSYLKVNGDTTLTPLIDSGIQTPKGLAYDTKLSKLYVADPGMRRIHAFTIAFANGVLAIDGEPEVAAHDVSAAWVAVDGRGDLFYSQGAPDSSIYKVDALKMLRKINQPTKLYSSELNEVNKPMGVAVDNFHVFWGNSEQGKAYGSITKGLENPEIPERSMLTVSANANAVSGLCLSMNNLYYSSGNTLYGVKKMGGAVATISTHMLAPTGCAWDGDSTVYVADNVGGALYAFPSNMHILGNAKVKKFADVDGPFGVTLIQASASMAALFFIPLLNMF